MSDTISLYSSISRSLLSKKLYKGSLLAGLAVLGLSILGAFTPPSLLSGWGWLAIFAAFLCIAWGLSPYKKLQAISIKPDKLTASKEGVTYGSHSKSLLFLPWQSIQDLQYREQNTYGLALCLAKNCRNKPTILHPSFKLKSVLRPSHKEQEVNLFFPFFNRRACQTLIEIWQEEKKEFEH